MILEMYVTLFSVILAGIGNMLFTKTALYRRLARPLDGGHCMSDGRRILGENKTAVGFAGMIVIAAAAQLLWGALCGASGLQAHNALYARHANTAVFNLAAGAAFGFAYMLCELPNSFLKRRLGIAAGKTERGLLGAVFFVVDQIDSLFGVALVLAFLTPLTATQYCGYVALGGVTHVAVNLVLYRCGVRKNW